MWKEFKAFAVQGNVFDLAIAVVIGTAFSKIVDSFVNDIVMPIAGLLLGGVNLTSQALPIRQVLIKYGAFLQATVDFFIIAFCIFVTIKLLYKIRGKTKIFQQESGETTEELLGEIRNLLKENNDLNGNKKKTPVVQLHKKNEKKSRPF